MAEFTEIELAMVNKLKAYYHDLIMAGLQQAGQAIPEFTGDDAHKTAILSAVASLEADNEYIHMLEYQASNLLMSAIEALPAQTKIDLGIDQLFP
jgi:hypothetical protein